MVENSPASKTGAQGQSRDGGSRRRRKRRRGKKAGEQSSPEAKDSSKSKNGKPQSKAQRQKAAAPQEEKRPKRVPKERVHVVKKYGVIFFDSFAQAQGSLEQIREKSATCDQLNVVIRAEGNMDDPILSQLHKVKVFAGTAWTTIHERRVADGWYDEPQ